MDKKSLVSLHELAAASGEKYQTIYGRFRRGAFTRVVSLSLRDARRMGLAWAGRGARGKGRPYIEIDDPAISAEVRKKLLAAGADANHVSLPAPASPGGLESDGGRGAFSPESELEVFSRLSTFQRRQVQKYLSLISETAGASGAQKKEAIEAWNGDNPDNPVSARSLARMRRRYESAGVAGLASGHGKRAGKSRIPDDELELFRQLYMTEGGPSAESCWLQVLGKSALGRDELPGPRAFLYQVRKAVPEEALFLSRHGQAAWNRRYGMHVDRDYSDLPAGDCWVSDHAQIDVAVFAPSGKPCFPWLTAWRDMKSSKWLGWLLHAEPPNSDHIFQAFFYGARAFGLPRHIYIDNGKDYRARDFAGGRKRAGKIRLDETDARNLCAVLGITPHFALPYNPQAKVIERDFLKIKEGLSKHVAGYRGGHVKERPERLAGDIKRGEIMGLEDFQVILGAHIELNINGAPSAGKVLGGRTPDELWEAEARISPVSRPEALAMLCMRTAGPAKITRNGIRDAREKAYYWAEWMAGSRGRRVIMRRDPAQRERGWIFCAETEELLGEALLVGSPAALAPAGDGKVADVLRSKARNKKIVNLFAGAERALPPGQSAAETVLSMAVGNRKRRGAVAAGGTKPAPEPEPPAIEKMAKKIQRASGSAGDADLENFLPAPLPSREKPVILDSERLTEAEKAAEAEFKKFMEDR